MRNHHEHAELRYPALRNNLLDDKSGNIRINFAYAINDRGQIAAVSGNEGSIMDAITAAPAPLPLPVSAPGNDTYIDRRYDHEDIYPV